MVGVIKVFGVLSVIVGVILIIISFSVGIIFVSVFLPAGASALLGGALLVVFARIVEVLGEMNEKLTPIYKLALALESKYHVDESQMASEAGGAPFDPNDPIVDPLSNLPPGSKIEHHFRRRVALLPDGTVLGETDGGLRRFKAFEEWRRFIGK